MILTETDSGIKFYNTIAYKYHCHSIPMNIKKETVFILPLISAVLLRVKILLYLIDVWYGISCFLGKYMRRWRFVATHFEKKYTFFFFKVSWLGPKFKELCKVRNFLKCVVTILAVLQKKNKNQRNQIFFNILICFNFNEFIFRLALMAAKSNFGVK